ncbi:MAG: hypothetical protein MJ072_04265, partial [Clostridia bacterium]|nr:hypothetical protein [Clostridia bacterium]
TIVSFATTLPEMLVSIIAAATGGVDGNSMAIGNAVGSVTANIGLIFALLMVAAPGTAKRSDFLLKGLLMLGACAVLAGFAFYGNLVLVGSVALLLIFAVFMVINVKKKKKAKGRNPFDKPFMDRRLKNHLEVSKNVVKGKDIKQEAPQEETERPEKTKKAIIINIVKFVLGAAGIAGGAFLLVDNGEIIATNILGIPVAIVSAIFIAIGTSLPELVTAITAIVKKQGALSMGNIIGANIIDLTVILPVCSFFTGGVVPFSAQNTYLDIPVCLLVGAIALVPTMFSQKIRRAQGVSMLVVYVAYIVIMCTVFMTV